MSNRRHLIYIPSFSEYAYREIKRANATQRQNLSDADMKILRDDASLRKFVHQAPMEHIDVILTKLGKTWDKRYYDVEVDADDIEQLTINQFRSPGQRLQAIEKEAKDHVYHMSSMDVMLSAHMASQNVHSNVYEISAKSRMAVNYVRALKTIKKPYSEQIQEAEEANDILNKLLLNQLNSMDWALKTLGLQQVDIRILASLFQKRHAALTMQDISKDTYFDGSRQYLKKNVEKLQEDGLIMSDANSGRELRKDKKKYGQRTFYMITTKGVDKMMKYRNYLHEITFGSRG